MPLLDSEYVFVYCSIVFYYTLAISQRIIIYICNYVFLDYVLDCCGGFCCRQSLFGSLSSVNTVEYSDTI